MVRLVETVQVEIEYVDTDGVITQRAVDIDSVSTQYGITYLEGWCHLRDEPRTFRGDRIRSGRLANGKTVEGGEFLHQMKEDPARVDRRSAQASADSGSFLDNAIGLYWMIAIGHAGWLGFQQSSWLKGLGVFAAYAIAGVIVSQAWAWLKTPKTPKATDAEKPSLSVRAAHPATRASVARDASVRATETTSTSEPRTMTEAPAAAADSTDERRPIWGKVIFWLAMAPAVLIAVALYMDEQDVALAAFGFAIFALPVVVVRWLYRLMRRRTRG